MLRYVCVLLVLSGVVYSVLGQDDECVYQPGELITQVMDEFDCVVLDCMNITINATEYVFDGWILPDVTYINSTYEDQKITVEEDSWMITVRNVTREDTGLYHCMLLLEGEYHLVRMGLNAKGPFFITAWEEYQKNTVIGLVALGSFLVLAAFVYLLNRYSYKDDDDDDGDYLGKKAIDAFGVEMDPPSTNPYGVLGHPDIPAYIPYHDANLTSDVRKRSPIVDKKLSNGDALESLGVDAKDGVVNPAFARETSVISDASVQDFMFTADHDRVPDEITEL